MMLIIWQMYLEKLNVKDGGITWLLAADLKVVNAILGLMAHGARTPCYACKWFRGADCDDAPERTFEGIAQKNQEWLESGADPSKLKDFENCRDPPLPLFPSEGPVGTRISPIQLHGKLGLTNDAVDGLMAVYPEAEAWPQQLHINKARYHGAKYEGRECDKLLNNIDKLRDMVAADNFSPRSTRSSTAQRLQHPAEPFIALLQAIKDVKDHVFGYELKDGWEETIRTYHIAFKATGTRMGTRIIRVPSLIP